MPKAKATLVSWWDRSQGAQVTVTNLTYYLNGQPATARLPWPMTAEIAMQWIERQRARINDRPHHP